jgi:hypothetical protein
MARESRHPSYLYRPLERPVPVELRESLERAGWEAYHTGDQVVCYRKPVPSAADRAPVRRAEEEARP